MNAGRHVLGIGVIGLGRAFTLMLPTFRGDARVRLVAGTDPRPEARARFAADFGARVHDHVDALCADPAVDVVYVASPHQHHAGHAIAAARAGRHALVEKPMALSLDEADAMVDAARAAGTVLVVGHSHAFDRPVLRTRELIAGGAYGDVRMITALNATDFMYRLRRPEELDTRAGGGVLLNQAAHQVDIVRMLGGGLVRSVRAHAAMWDASRPTEGAYSAFVTFANGCAATLTYSGYAHFDADELMGWIGELGARKDPAQYGAARRALAAATDRARETSLKNARNYGGDAYAPSSAQETLLHEHFGFVLASCERADLRPLPDGVMVYADAQAKLEALAPPAVPRQEVIDELHAAVVDGAPPRHDGTWARATLEVCLALLASSREAREITLQKQTAWPD
jgi:phthalate 4,5-cis-dihydrodiol dehydrogenase